MTVFNYKGFDVEILKIKDKHRAVIQCEAFHRVIEPLGCTSEREARHIGEYTDKTWEAAVREIIDHFCSTKFTG